MIIIFSKPIHSGKTTELLNWCNKYKNYAGVLMPDKNNQRYFYDIATSEYFVAQSNQVESEEQNIIKIGKYIFYKDAFEKANNIVINSFQNNFQNIIVDEVGKLELQEMGFHRSLKYLLDHFSNSKKNLLLVVRDSLVNDVINFYNLKEYRIIKSILDFA